MNVCICGQRKVYEILGKTQLNEQSEANLFSEWNSVTRLSVILVAIVFVGIVSVVL